MNKKGAPMTAQKEYIITESRLKEILAETCKGATWVNYQRDCVHSRPYKSEAVLERLKSKSNILVNGNRMIPLSDIEVELRQQER